MHVWTKNVQFFFRIKLENIIFGQKIKKKTKILTNWKESHFWSDDLILAQLSDQKNSLPGIEPGYGYPKMSPKIHFTTISLSPLLHFRPQNSNAPLPARRKRRLAAFFADFAGTHPDFAAKFMQRIKSRIREKKILNFYFKDNFWLQIFLLL